MYVHMYMRTYNFYFNWFYDAAQGNVTFTYNAYSLCQLTLKDY